MKAKFIGTDGSMGFNKGAVYEIETYVSSQWLRSDGYLWVKDKKSHLKCPYSRLETMLLNWEILEEEE